MNSPNADGYVLPRPVERLPDYASARSRQALAERIVEAFHLSPEGANAIANAVVDPSEVRKSIGEPTAPQAEEIAVPGGVLLGVRTSVWARRTMPDPRNPRLLPSRKHPFAVDPGTGGEESKFRPIAEPGCRSGAPTNLGELLVKIESRHQLTWASQMAAAYVLSENDWRSSIAAQGVMEAVWLVATTYEHDDGSAPVTTLTTAEGSSRITGTHHLLGVRSSDVPYEDADAKLRAHIRKLNDAYQRGPSADDMTALRCERVPALILLGFRPHDGGATGFPTAVKSLVALRHVDPPKPWGDGPENESLADEVLDEMYRRDLISETQRAYFAGSCTRAEAVAAHLAADPAIRSAQIVRTFTSSEPRIVEAIRIAVTSQSTRKRITTKLLNELATALILRAVGSEPDRMDQIRRYLRHSFGSPVHGADWNATNRDTETLQLEALKEVERSVLDESITDPGPTTVELGVRAAYALIVTGRLNADRGTANNDQPDRRTPGQVLDAMRRRPQGVRQLGRALLDFAEGIPIRAVDEEGRIKKLENGPGDVHVNDIYIRGEFPAEGKARAPRPGDTPLDQLHNTLNSVALRVEELKEAFERASKITGDSGQPLVDSRGVDPIMCVAWRKTLSEMQEQLIVWGSTYKRTVGTRRSDVLTVSLDDESGSELDSDPERGLMREWDSATDQSV